MKKLTKKPFNMRALVALIIALAGLGLPVTGIANHVHQMEPMTVQRHAWMAAHNMLGTLFVVFSIVHIILNRRALLKYASGLATRLPRASREATCAAALIAVVLTIAVGHALHQGH